MPTEELSIPSPSARSAFEVGQKLAGIYILRQQISGGAEGEIWLAHDEVLGKDVSLHFIPTSLRGDTRAMGEIRQEIKRNRQLIHPGILRVYDLVEEPEWSAISMDWFEGESLASALKKRPAGFFEAAEVKPWLQQVCHTLDDIHKIQIMHRDVAPHNIFVDARGKVLLAKFGISRVIEDALARANKGSGPDPRLASLSPQSLDGEHPSKADDVYSVGATIYELLTGELPFTGPDLLPQIRKNTPQPMAERRAQRGQRGGAIPAAWEKWVAAALAKASTERPASAGELAAKLGLSGKLPLEPIPAPTPAIAVPAAAVVAAVAAPAAGLAATAGTPEPAEVTPAAATDAPAPDTVSESVGEKTPEPPSEIPAPIEAPVESTASATPPTAEAVSPASATVSVPAAAAEPKAEETPEPKIELPPRGPGIKLPPSRLAAVAAAESERKSAGKADETPVDRPAPAPEEKPAAEPHALDEDREIDRKEEAEADRYEDRPASGVKSSALVFGGLIVLVAALAYLLNRPGKEDPKPLTGGPVNAQVTPAPSTPTVVTESNPAVEPATPKKATGLIDEPLLATATPVPPPATPVIAKPTPEVPPVIKTTEPAFVLTGDPEKDYANAVKWEQSTKEAVAQAEKAVTTKGKEIVPIVKSGEPLLAVRNRRLDDVKAAEEAADAARQAADAKAKALEDAKKAQADWEAANGPKLAAYDKASNDFKALNEGLAEKRQQAEAAKKAVAAADAARQQQSAKARKEKEEADARLADKKAEEARLLKEQQDRNRKIDDEIAEMQRRLEALRNQRSGAAPATPAPSTPSPSSPAPPVSSTPRAIPSPPPPPKPVQQTGGQNEFLQVPPVPLTPATPTAIAMTSTPVRVINSAPPATPAVAIPLAPSTPQPAEIKATPQAEASTGENSLGLKFAPVGDVAFCIWPTRLQDFDVFAKETGFRNNAWKSPGFKQGPDHPVVNISWNDAIAFCKWLTDRDRKKGLLPKDQIYRLPTDLEWSKAVGLPEESGKSPEARDMSVPDVFPWGTQWPPPPNVGNYTGEETGSDVAIKGYDDGFAWTSPVGSFPPNKFGLYDVGGNVWQWCMDNWSPESKAKVLRGASWYNGALKLSLLSSCRVSANPDSSTDNYGFRIVRASESKGGRPR